MTVFSIFVTVLLSVGNGTSFTKFSDKGKCDTLKIDGYCLINILSVAKLYFFVLFAVVISYKLFRLFGCLLWVFIKLKRSPFRQNVAAAVNM